ncbi:MAG: class I SAM-dependent methyltransferase [Salegentibacter mishustinae]|nr:class I SAM-dependent methyltransferase [Salegentibacter mishustinae]
MSFDGIYENLVEIYDKQIKRHGPNIQGVDWNSREAQEIRFEQLLKICEGEKEISIIDYGCGYGALADFISSMGLPLNYTGYDISPQMVTSAEKMHQNKPFYKFTNEFKQLVKADYTVGSGLFNLKLENDDNRWEKYIFHTLDKMRSLSEKGFAFNMLTKYSDPEKMRFDLYYADPSFIFDYCKNKFSKNVALLHDYQLYDFTILVRL